MPNRLRDAGLRVTAPRLAMLDAIPPGAHLDADTVATEVRARLGRVSTQAVYDVLRALTGAGGSKSPAARPRGTSGGCTTTTTIWSAAPAAAWWTCPARPAPPRAWCRWTPTATT